MALRDASTRPNNPRRTQDERLKDEVYRHMFRLEASRPGAGLDLAVALVRAWLAADSGRGRPAMREWLKKICPICLSMIEASQQTSDTGQRCIQ
jgi:hypothetical protein